MNYSQMQSEVLRCLDESGSTFWTAADVQSAINEGYQEISDYTEWFETNDTLTLVANQIYYDLRTVLDYPVLTMKHIWNATMNRWLSFVDVRDLDFRTYQRWEVNTGEPEMAFLRGLWKLGVYPKKAAAGSLTAYFTALPNNMSSATDSPEFPAEFHQGIIDYALYDLLIQDGNIKGGMSHWKKYLEYRTELKSWVLKRIARDKIYGPRG